MFILHSSNKTENLVEHLTAVLQHAPLSSPFAPEFFLIQSLGMERWLFQQLASRFPVWANYRFLFPERFFSSIANRLGIANAPGAFDRNCLLWRIEALLRKLDGDDFSPLRTYLAGNNPAMKRFQLAGQIAQLFDQYQIMRPDLLASWQQGEMRYRTADERWQKALWLSLTAETGTSHRGQQWLDVIDRFNRAPENSLANIVPERLCLFGINTMPPLLLSYLQSLSRHCQIHLFLLNPSQTYWADIGNKHRQSGGVESPPHPLLVSLGQQGRRIS